MGSTISWVPMKTGVLALALLATWTTAAAATDSDRVERHSGRVVIVDRLRDMVVVEEIGSWDAATERAAITRNRIHFTGLTEFKIFVRTRGAGKYRGEFGEIPLRVTNVFPGDTVTAECVRAGNRLVALSIVLAEPF
jgi:hypothetical protein